MGTSMREWWASGLAGALSLRTLCVGAPLLIFAGALLAGPSTDAGLVVWTVFAVGGYLAVMIGVLLLRPAIDRLPATQCRWITLGTLSLVGPVGMLAAIGVGALAGLQTDLIGLLPEIVLAALLGVWLLVGARLSRSLDDDAHDREDLLRALARERALALESTRVVEADRRRLLEDVRSTVTSRVQAMSEAPSSSRDAADDLQRLIDEAVRPLSHELHDAQVREDELVEQIATMRVPNPRPLWSYTRSLATVDRGDVGLAIGMGVAGVIAMIVGYVAGVGPAVAVLPLVYSLVLAVVLLLSSARSSSTRDERVQAVRAADWMSSLVRQAAWVTRRQLANTMHGEVQGRILACALRIRDLPAPDGAREIEQLADDLHRVIGSDLGDGDWRIAWDRLVTMWEFTIDLTVEWSEVVDARLDRDAVAGSALVAVVGEAVTNAVRHGSARSILVAVAPEGESALVVDVVDDGVAASLGEPSLGSATLDAVCLRWRLATHPAGHHFQATLALRGSSEKTEHQPEFV